jgi:hypothetical protein
MKAYSEAHGAYPQSFSNYRGYSTAAPPIRKLARLSETPRDLADFLSVGEARKGLYTFLKRLSIATMADVAPFLPEEGEIIAADSPSAISVPDSSENEEEEHTNHPEHPGGNWIEYSFGQTDHYPVIIDDGEDQVTTNYIRYVFDGEETYVEGTNHKNGPIYRLALHARPQLQPNFDNDKQIRDDHLNVFHPESSLRDFVDQAVHNIADPGLTADLVRYRSRKARHATLLRRLQAAEEALLENTEALVGVERHLIHAKACTRVFNQVYAVKPESERPYRVGHVPTLKASQGPPDTTLRTPTPSSQTRFAPYRRPKMLEPIFCFECMQSQSHHLDKDCPSAGTCCYCQSTGHESLQCPTPHVQCHETRCSVPSWLTFHGLQCPAPAMGRLAKRLGTPLDAFPHMWAQDLGMSSTTMEED